MEYNLRLLEELDCRGGGDVEFFIYIPTEVEARVRTLLQSKGLHRHFVVLHPGSGGSAKDWSPENFGKLAECVGETDPDLKVVVTGSRGEEALCERVVRASGGRAISLAGELALKDLAALIGSARAFVSNSTGPLHVAAAIGTPVVGLFPPHRAMSKERWGPYTSSRKVLVPDTSPECGICNDGATGCPCMNSISVPQVAEALFSLIRDTTNAKANNEKA